MVETLSPLRLGVAITTMNRRDIVVAQINTLRRLTGCAFELVVCDDGSSDHTREAVMDLGEVVIAGVNRGTAWNKNRGLFYLMAVRGCDIVILLDDDVLPVEQDWQARWVEGATRYGHVNFIMPNMLAHLPDTDCTPENPGLTTKLLGCCIASHRYAWNMVGYMDSRFGKYGHEHTEFTNRFLCNGFGGVRHIVAGRMEHHYYVIGGGIQLQPATSSGTPEDIASNLKVWREIQHEDAQPFRPPWRDGQQRTEFLSEMRLALRSNHVVMPRQYEDFLSTC
jgi:glycosyltransferase involved in cell wall biosynthesis